MHYRPPLFLSLFLLALAGTRPDPKEQQQRAKGSITFDIGETSTRKRQRIRRVLVGRPNPHGQPSTASIQLHREAENELDNIFPDVQSRLLRPERNKIKQK